MEDVMKKHSKRVVVVGGGTGNSVLLRGLKHFTENITAIVTVSDDGGGSGILREDLGMLPPGDIRSCILALADDESVMQRLLNYRFAEGSLKGQSFGNLFIAAMNGISGDFMRAIKDVSDVMAIKGTVLPVSLDRITLSAQLKDGEIVNGESEIPRRALFKKSPIKMVKIHPESVRPLPDAIKAIMDAQAVIIGPGSLYTSIIPDLLVHGIEEALQNTKAKRFYIPNIMTQPGETDGYGVCDHIDAIERHLRHPEKKIFDYVLVDNNDDHFPAFEKYRREGAHKVRFSPLRFQRTPYQAIIGDYLEIKQNYIRHDAKKIAESVLERVPYEKV